MKLFGRGDKEKEASVQYRRDMVVAHTQNRANNPLLKQQIDSMGSAFFLHQDEEVVRLIMTHCPELIPAFSRMNATSKIMKDRDREKFELQLEALLLRLEMRAMRDDDGESRNFIKALRIFGTFRILDAMKGYRGELVTHEVERTTHIIEEPKKKGIL